MKPIIALVLSCTAGALLTTHAVAQNESNPQDKASQAPQPAATQQPTALQQANAQEFFKASDLVGKTAQDSHGKKVGSVKEVTFNQQGEIFAFVDVGNGKWAAVPWQAVNPASAKGRGNLSINATEQQLKAAPAVTKDQWGSLNNPKFVEGCYAYYNVQAPNATGGSSSPGGQSTGSGASSGTSSQPAQTDSSSTSTSQTNSQDQTSPAPEKKPVDQ